MLLHWLRACWRPEYGEEVGVSNSLTRSISLIYRLKRRIGPLILGKMSKLAGCRRLSILVSAVKTRVAKKNLNSFRFSIRILVDSDETFGTL